MSILEQYQESEETKKQEEILIFLNHTCLLLIQSQLEQLAVEIHMVLDLKKQETQGIGNNQIELITLEMNLVELEQDLV